LGDSCQYKIFVNNVARKGISFSMLSVCDIKIGDILEVTFTLDDTNKTVICKQVEVKSVHNRLIGCYFTCPQWYDKELGFYLMNTDSRVKKSLEEL